MPWMNAVRGSSLNLMTAIAASSTPVVGLVLNRLQLPAALAVEALLIDDVGGGALYLPRWLRAGGGPIERAGVLRREEAVAHAVGEVEHEQFRLLRVGVR